MGDRKEKDELDDVETISREQALKEMQQAIKNIQKHSPAEKDQDVCKKVSGDEESVSSPGGVTKRADRTAKKREG